MTTFDPKTARLASLGQRFLGFVIDAIILGVISLPVTFAFLGEQLTDPTAPFGAVTIPPQLTLTVTVISGLYFVVFTALRGQTPGKAFVRSRVVSFEVGEIPSWGQSFIRWAIPAAAGAIPPLGLLVLVVYGWILYDPLRQGFHDKVAQTLVIDVRPRMDDFAT